MAPYRMPKYSVPLSALGVLIGGGVLFKEYVGGKQYKSSERCVGKTVLVTGANTGIGKETCRELARRGAKVIMACRDLEKCEKARAEIVVETANRNLHCRRLDLSSMASIRAFAFLVNQSENHLDVLINNAGVMRCPKLLTEDGFEMQLGVNHLGHFLLTLLLLEKLKQSSPSRIINLSSIAHTRGQINFQDLNSAKHYDSAQAYGQSKLANVLFTRELASRLEGSGVSVNAVHPGIVKTELGRHMSVNKSYLSSTTLGPVTWMFMKTPKQGAQTTLYCALEPGLEKATGKYYSDCREKEVAPQALDTAAGKRLWAISEKWTRVT